jgi:hypothetical protein
MLPFAFAIALFVPLFLLLVQWHRLRVAAACRLADPRPADERGEKLIETPWGGANIDGVEMWDNAKVIVFERGVAVRIHPWISPGELWMPIASVAIERCKAAGFWGGEAWRISGGGDYVVLSAALAHTPGLLTAIRRAKFW